MDKKNKMYRLGLYEKAMPSSLTWLEKLNLAKEIGYDYLEISVDETDEKLSRLDRTSEIEEIRSAISITGLPIMSMCLSGHRKYPLGSKDKIVRDKGLEIFYKAVDLAVELGVHTIQLAGYDVYYEESSNETENLFFNNLVKGIDYAASRQIICGFETMETDFMNTISKAMKYVNIINSPYLHIYPDLGNLTNAAITEGDLYLDMLNGKGHIVAAHLKETVPGVFRETLFDTGHVDFDKGIKSLWDLGVRSYVCECWYTGQDNYIEELKFNYKFLTDKINKMLI